MVLQKSKVLLRGSPGRDFRIPAPTFLAVGGERHPGTQAMTGDIKIRDSRQDSEDNSSWSGSSFDESERRSSTPHNQQNQPARQGTSSSRQASVSESQAGKPKQKRAFKGAIPSLAVAIPAVQTC